MAVATILSAVAGLRYEAAIPLPERDEDGAAVLVAALLAVLLLTFLSSGTLYWCSTHDLVPKYLSLVREYAWLLPVSVLTSGIQMVFYYWAIRKRTYVLLARTRLWQSLVLVVAQIILGVANVGPLGLILGFMLGQAAGTGSLLSATWRDDRASFQNVTPTSIVRNAIAYWRFPAYSSPSALLDTLKTSVPPLVLSAVFGAPVAGSFAFSQRVFGLPSALIGRSLSQVYFAELANTLHRDRSRIFATFCQVTRVMTLAGAGLAVTALAAPRWFPLVFGLQWTSAAFFSQLLAPSLALGLAFAPTANFTTFGLNSWELAWDVAQVLLVAVSVVWIRSQPMSPAWGVALFSATTSIGYLALYFLNRRAHWIISRRVPVDANSVESNTTATKLDSVIG